jgi:2-hydroxychromene-2-carboxylate isomerase
MDRAIDFYFDFTSPYSYLAASRIEDVAARHGRAVRWHPVLIAALADASGVKLSPFIPSKWTYAQHDVARAARKFGLPFRLPPGFPRLWLAPARAMLWIRARHGDETARAFARACYSAAFGAGIDMADAENVATVAAPLGIDQAALKEGIESAPIKAALKDGIDTAIARGVFGVPFMVADGEAFWGSDRLDDLEHHLAQAER